jgi:hypothetical protein
MNHFTSTNRENAQAIYERLYQLSWDGFLDRLFHGICTNSQNEESDGKFRTPLWDFTRIARGHPLFKKKSGREALQMVEHWLTERGLTWEGFPDISEAEDARIEFLRLWEIIRFAPGETPLEVAFEKAKQIPVQLDKHQQRTEGYRAFIGLCYWLQKIMGEKHRILLPCEKLAVILKCEPKTISRYRQFAVMDGFLQVKKSHSYNPNSGRGDATEFLFDLERFG